MMEYEKTHPWMSFTLDLRNLPWVTWVRLGEAASKCVHLTKVPLRPDTRDKIQQVYLAKGVSATTAIEGNTLTEEEVLEHLDGNLELPPSKEYLAQEVDNIVAICNTMLEKLSTTNDLPELTSELVCDYNRQVRADFPEGTDLAPPGHLRTGSVIVGRVYRGAPAQDCPHLLNRLCQWLRTGFTPQEGYTLPFAILKAVMAHLYLAWIHPFDDGNGRTARLLELHILLQAGVPAPAAHLLSNHYNETRSEYARQLDYASKSGGNVLPFIDYAVQGFIDGLRQQMEYIWDQQWDISWQNHVYQVFKGREKIGEKRARRLALALGELRKWVPLGELPVLTPGIAQDYTGKSPKTLTRDLKTLTDHQLVEIRDKQIRANRHLIHAYRPIRKVT